MKHLFFILLKCAYWLSYPVSAALLHNSKRTRLLVQSGDEILLVKTSFGAQKWSLPGGGMKRNETSVQAALRELKEETGLVLEPTQIKSLGELSSLKTRRWPVAQLHLFGVQLNQKQIPTITRKFEIMEAAWHPVNALPQPLSHTAEEALRLHLKQCTMV